MCMCGGATWGMLTVKGRYGLFAGNTVQSISECVRGVREDALYKSTLPYLTFTFVEAHLTFMGNQSHPYGITQCYLPRGSFLSRALARCRWVNWGNVWLTASQASNRRPFLKWHAWFVNRCPGRHLSTWQMIAASCLTVLGALYGQLTSRPVWYHKHTEAMETELLQPLDLVCGTLYQSNCAIQTSPTDCFDYSWRDTFLGTMDTAFCDFWYVAP